VPSEVLSQRLGALEEEMLKHLTPREDRASAVSEELRGEAVTCRPEVAKLAQREAQPEGGASSCSE